MQNQTTTRPTEDVSRPFTNAQLVSAVEQSMSAIKDVLDATSVTADYPELDILRSLCSQVLEVVGDDRKLGQGGQLVLAYLVMAVDHLQDVASEALRYRRQNNDDFRGEIRLTTSPCLDRGLI